MKDYCNTSILANCIRGMESVGGKLFFDETGMTFKAHKLNIQREDARIEYKDITGIQKRNTLGLVPNGISVFTNNGKEYKFVINNRKNVIGYLQNKSGIST